MPKLVLRLLDALSGVALYLFLVKFGAEPFGIRPSDVVREVPFYALFIFFVAYLWLFMLFSQIQIREELETKRREELEKRERRQREHKRKDQT